MKSKAELRRSTQAANNMEDLFVPYYRAENMPSAEKRSAYALEHIAFRMGRIDQHLQRLIEAIAALTNR